MQFLEKSQNQIISNYNSNQLILFAIMDKSTKRIIWAVKDDNIYDSVIVLYTGNKLYDFVWVTWDNKIFYKDKYIQLQKSDIYKLYDFFNCQYPYYDN